MDANQRSVKSNPAALLPIGVFLVLYLGCGLLFEYGLKIEQGFYQTPAIVIFLIALAVACFQNRKLDFNAKMKVMAAGVADENILTMCLVFLAAGAFSGAVSAAGGADSTVFLFLDYLPSQFAVAGLFLISCFVSVSMGTSVGTISALAPFAVSMSKATGFELVLCIAAVACGAMFGDNLSMISDTTIAAVRTQGCEMKDKFRMNFFIAFPAAVLSLIFYGFIGGAGSGSIEVGAFDLFQIAPYIVVLVTALMGINVAVVLFIGILMTFIVGLLQGNVGFFDIAMAVGDGMADMFSISIVAILVSGVIGLVRYYGGIEWMIDTITKKIKNRKQAEYGIGILSGILSGAMVNNTIAIIVTCPIAKEIGSKYKIAPKRLASLVDIFACAFLAVMPHDGGMLMTSEMANISPFAILPYSVYPLFLIIATCITIQAGLLRTAEEKQKK